MREIKFRAWDNLSKKIVAFNGRKWCPNYGQHINIKYVTEKEDTILKLISKFFYGSDLELSYMQYTGLKDKNGVEIYEGDIVAFDNNGFNDKGVVIYDAPCFIVEGFFLIDSSLKVIGNIYENQDLLKG